MHWPGCIRWLVAIGGGFTIGAGDTGRAWAQVGAAKGAQGACHGRYVKG